LNPGGRHDQRVQRVRGGGDAERFHLVARRSCHRRGVFLLGGEAELFRQFRIERRNRRRCSVIGLRRFVETGCIALSRRHRWCPSSKRARDAPRLAPEAAVPGIVRRRLQAGARTHAGIAAI